ncbi:hypothetical protein BS78_06G110600 [Paspalum vaginatum]|nr:hypothetical protein BS78_06G110600 [Paspalum vaginatum]
MAIQDPPVDLEKGATDVKAAAAEELTVVVDPCKAMCIKIVLGVVYSLDIIGLTLLMVKCSQNWRDTWLAFILYPILLVSTLWMAPIMLGKIIQRYATKHVLGSGLTTKLLAPSKE